MNPLGGPPIASDYDKLARCGIPRSLVDQALLRRVSSVEGAAIVGQNGKGNYAGLLFPYIWPGEDHVREYRLRRDAADVNYDALGKPREKRKYLAPPGRGNLLYVVPGTPAEWLKDASLPVAITEGEKKGLALWVLSHSGAEKPRFLPLALSGVWNWHGKIGRESGPDGKPRDIKGVIPQFNEITWAGRKAYIVFDTNTRADWHVRTARAQLAKELQSRGADVWYVDLPEVPDVNGVDDLLALWGPARVLALFDKAVPVTADWRAELVTNRDGEAKALLVNAIAALKLAPEWAGVLAFNEFTYEITVTDTPPSGIARTGDQWSDVADIRTAEWLQQRGIFVTPNVAGQAVQSVAQLRAFHPVREYLDSLEWDGTKRIDGWLWLYLGVKQSTFSCAAGARWLVQAVARIYRPGVQADAVLILEGEQGTFKSTALRTLFEPWFIDHISELGSKDSQLETRGMWCFEFAELDNLSKPEAGRVKAFISRRQERFRPPFGRRVVYAPRQCVFAGSVNKWEYLKDETGGRRFWPVTCGTIKVDELGKNRDQLWAEAKARFDAGGVWWLDTPELNAAAGEEQEARYDADVWQPLIEAWVEARDYVTTEQVLTMCLEKPKAQLTQTDKNRVSRCLQAMHWKKVRERIETGAEKDREYRYRRGKR